MYNNSNCLCQLFDNNWVWLIILALIVFCCGCGGNGCGNTYSGGCGCGNCGC